MRKRVGGFVLICVAIGMFLMLFIPKGVLTVLSIIGLIYLGYRFLDE
jgi:hypothetical protein